ncbi:hypothetical protein CPB83DRAFT_859952 [Crepidotus variabilis]|uniref:Uncharacterized protein n=1 Tax=Crepidotus variabilis TaxID=179855 RepID=A0A9P6JLU5_9AGAR|nr:hypothetical protein CPB83DRAFT_859952 [Crepidotus variabilis]
MEGFAPQYFSWVKKFDFHPFRHVDSLLPRKLSTPTFYHVENRVQSSTVFIFNHPLTLSFAFISTWLILLTSFKLKYPHHSHRRTHSRIFQVPWTHL